MTNPTRPAWDGVPSLTQPTPGPPVPSAVAAALRRSPDRRGVLRGGLALGGALALTVLGWLPPAGRARARAEIGTEHLTCDVFQYDDLICVPPVYDPRCCGRDGWFRSQQNDRVVFYPVIACNGRNAWRWTDEGTPYRCADGQIQRVGRSPVFAICNFANPT